MKCKNFNITENFADFQCFAKVSDDYLELTGTNAADAAKTAEKIVPEVYPEAHINKLDHAISAAEMSEEQQPSVSQKGFFSLKIQNFFTYLEVLLGLILFRHISRPIEVLQV